MNIIGAGNVGHFFGKALTEAGIDVKSIYNRTIQKADKLAKICDSLATDDLLALPHSDLNIVAISDDHIPEVIQNMNSLHGDNIPIVHTSGVQNIELFSSLNCGCIWPLYSLTSRSLANTKKVPLCIDSASKTFLKDLECLCKQISDKVSVMPSKQKKHAHVTAVIANNFTNHLLTLAEKYSTDHDIDFDIFKPLIIDSIIKIENESPKDIQTGPAKRGDYKTIKKHLKLIEDRQLKKIYKQITKSIVKTYHENS